MKAIQLALLTVISCWVLPSPINSHAQTAGKEKMDDRFNRWDKNGDGELSRDELPEQIRVNFNRVDANKDGTISLGEHLAFLNRGGNRSNKNAATSNARQVPEGTRIHRDLEYVAGGHERHRLDLYLPATASNDNPVSLIIWIHGGGWQKGSKNNPRGLGPLLEKGLAVASINYRLSEHAAFPAQIHDCKAAVRYLRKQAGEYGIDPDRFGVWGSSAGGHLVALMGTSGEVKELEGTIGVTGVSSRVQAVCDWFGPTDLLKMNQQAGEKGAIDHDAADSPESKLIGGSIQDNQEKTAKASPIVYVTRDDPPFLIMHGDEDRLVPVQQSKLLKERLDNTGVKVELQVIEGAGHGFRDAEHIHRVVDFFVSQFLSRN